jgi:hypothetical protein
MELGSDPSSCETTAVTINLSSAPLVGNSQMKAPENGQPMTLVFDLRNEDMERFIDTLRNRGLVCLTPIVSNHPTVPTRQ